MWLCGNALYVNTAHWLHMRGFSSGLDSRLRRWAGLVTASGHVVYGMISTILCVFIATPAPGNNGLHQDSDLLSPRQHCSHQIL